MYNKLVYKCVGDEEIEVLEPVELSEADYLKIARENKDRRDRAARRREGFRKARAALEAEEL